MHVADFNSDPVNLSSREFITSSLLSWYTLNQRNLPWRDNPDPYFVWVSEVMLQQTRVDTVIPYFYNWINRFPSIESLAYATEQEILKCWEGLGYYSRARNLHKAAGIICREFGGKLPCKRSKLEELPGIGPYTAGAIASIACGMDEPVLDGNVTRVYARLYNLNFPVKSGTGRRYLYKLAVEVLPRGKAGTYNQALMDLGATICLPRQPLCSQCPLSAYCVSFSVGNQEERPIRQVRIAVPHYTVTAAVIWKDGNVLIARRPSHGLLGGLWEFPGGKVEAGEELAEGLKREIREELGVDITVGREIGVFNHAYTHFKIKLHAFNCQIIGGEPAAIAASEIQWIEPGNLGSFPMGKIDRQISNLINL
jgi:A/G-specific adenine glycosylase